MNSELRRFAVRFEVTQCLDLDAPTTSAGGFGLALNESRRKCDRRRAEADAGAKASFGARVENAPGNPGR